MTKILVNTIEDCLALLSKKSVTFLNITIEDNDAIIMRSITNQVVKGTALTDRQYSVIKEKLLTYKSQFEHHNVVGFSAALDNLRLPLRIIDRTKYITVVDTPDYMEHMFLGEPKVIKVRFLFSKSLIKILHSIKSTNHYFHETLSHDYFFTYHESHIFDLVSKFCNKGFAIDEELITMYDDILAIKATPEKYVGTINSDGLHNLHPAALTLAEDELGKFSQVTKLLYIDRKKKYGIDVIPDSISTQIIDKIAYRENIEYLSNPSNETLPDMLTALQALNRFPILVVFDKQYAEDNIRQMLEHFNGIIPSEEQSVLFRLDGDDSFNQLIKNNNLNNWVDKNTKVVYISSTKLPKLLLKTDWSPSVTVSFTSATDRTVDIFVYNTCDLVIYREETYSPFRKHSRYYGKL